MGELPGSHTVCDVKHNWWLHTSGAAKSVSEVVLESKLEGWQARREVTHPDICFTTTWKLDIIRWLINEPSILKGGRLTTDWEGY